jgi:glycosyltransferase involved in cell wall biosynthesis
VNSPIVTFVVPCYKLAHLLRECIQSILEQTFQNYEILIMDDCSPDETPEVARSFADRRVLHVRNNPNLGHLRNYNRGISLAKGKYIWLISADDRLNSPHVLGRYVQMMEANSSIGYAFCPAMRLEDGQIKELLDYSVLGPTDQIINGRTFLNHLIYANTIVAPSAMARKECYEKVSMFPLNMPWGGDWYLWCVFALHYDVAYFAEPMVCYRRHACSMTNQLMDGHVESCSNEDIALPWTIKRQAQRLHLSTLVKHCRLAIAKEYARTMSTMRYLAAMPALSEQNFLHSLQSHASSSREYRWIRARTYAAMGDIFYWRGDFAKAQQSYCRALVSGQWLPQVWMQYALLRAGSSGKRLRQGLGSMRCKIARMPAANGALGYNTGRAGSLASQAPATRHHG